VQIYARHKRHGQRIDLLVRGKDGLAVVVVTRNHASHSHADSADAVNTQSPTARPSYFPAVGGYRFGLVTFPPACDAAEGRRASASLDRPATLAEMEEKLPGFLAYLEPDNPGMHTTDTIDFEVVLSGEVTLELDNGVEKVLRPGDTVVQNGTRHRWENRGTEPAVLAVVLIGAHRASD
jgi:mannose-6-phosphate isomerase-like protein (cupin superfamily)